MKKAKENYDFDLIISKEIIDQQQKELRNKIIKNNKKIEKQQRVLKIIIILIVITIISLLLFANKKMTDNFMKSCQENGYSYNYCLEHS